MTTRTIRPRLSNLSGHGLGGGSSVMWQVGQRVLVMAT